MTSKRVSGKKVVEWAETALLDLRLIVEYIAAYSTKNAKDSLAKIKRECEAFGMFPEMGKIPAELDAVHIGNIRELVVAPWRIFYRCETSRIVIISVLDSRRDFEDIKISRMIRGV